MFKENIMGLMDEKEVKSGEGIYEQNKLEELTPANGDSIGFYLSETPMLEGDDGDFMVCNGLLVDLSCGTVEDLVKSARPVSFVPKSILQKDIEDENWVIGQIARLENSNRPGDLNKKGKKTRYFAWKIFVQNAPNDVIKQLKAALSALKEEMPTEEAPKDKPKV